MSSGRPDLRTQSSLLHLNSVAIGQINRLIFPNTPKMRRLKAEYEGYSFLYKLYPADLRYLALSCAQNERLRVGWDRVPATPLLGREKRRCCLVLRSEIE
jgi:hypothetical protein